ncbi:MAG: hypothetical protein AB7I41_04420 [Candidatus Sericytochromatia bacterium]
MHNSFDLIILGQDPAICLLALLAAQSGHHVAVAGSALETPFWGVASAPFDWFGESEPKWQKSWIKGVFNGLVRFVPEKMPDLLQFPYYHLDSQLCYQTMRQDAETWGAVFFDGLPELDPEGVRLNETLLLSPVCFDLRPEAVNLAQGRWIWPSDVVLSAPGIFEIYPQQGPLWMWAESLAESFFSLNGLAAAPPELVDFFSDPEDLAVFTVPPVFLPQEADLQPITWQGAVLRLSPPSVGPDPWRAVLQAIYLLWARYAGHQIALRGFSDPLLRQHLQGYWQKLLTVAKQKREKNYFLQ